MPSFTSTAIFTSLFSLILPIACIRCEIEGAIICPDCVTHFRDPRIFGGTFVNSKNFPTKISSSLPYGEVVSRIVLGAKDDGNDRLQKIIVESLLRARALFPPNLTLVPIPSTSGARRRRGRDFVLEITKKVAYETGDCVEELLISRRKSAPQKSLNARERIENMAGAFSCRSMRSDRISPLLIVDDVLTTGATMRAALRALASSGATCTGAISAAYSPNWKVSQARY